MVPRSVSIYSCSETDGLVTAAEVYRSAATVVGDGRIVASAA